jgi:hypothetical protein
MRTIAALGELAFSACGIKTENPDLAATWRALLVGDPRPLPQANTHRRACEAAIRTGADRSVRERTIHGLSVSRSACGKTTEGGLGWA